MLPGRNVTIIPERDKTWARRLHKSCGWSRTEGKLGENSGDGIQESEEKQGKRFDCNSTVFQECLRFPEQCFPSIQPRSPESAIPDSRPSTLDSRLSTFYLPWPIPFLLT